MMMLLNIKGLMPNREGDIRKTALNVWSKFYSRDDVKKKLSNQLIQIKL
jgi:hypothetical protein